MFEAFIVALAAAGFIWIANKLGIYGKNVANNWFSLSVRIEGTWATEINEISYTEKVELTRFGYTVKGTITCISSPNNEDNGRKYNFKGTFKDKLLIADYVIDDSGKSDPGCFYLKLVNDGSKFEGYTLLYNHLSDELMSCEYKWNKS